MQKKAKTIPVIISEIDTVKESMINGMKEILGQSRTIYRPKKIALINGTGRILRHTLR